MSHTADDQKYDYPSGIPLRYENTYQLDPTKKFPQREVKTILKDVLDSYLAEEKYEPELCKQMSKTLSEVSKIIIYLLYIYLFIHYIYLLYSMD